MTDYTIIHYSQVYSGIYKANPHQRKPDIMYKLLKNYFFIFIWANKNRLSANFSALPHVVQAPIVKPLVRALIFKSSTMTCPMNDSFLRKRVIDDSSLFMSHHCVTRNFYWPRWLYNVTECCNNKAPKTQFCKLYYVMQLRHNTYVIMAG